jgi:hypothetical protein
MSGTHDDFAFEPVRGLPEALPPGEEILWQGRPDAWRLAVEAFKLRWVAGYFAALAAWRVGVSAQDLPFGEALPHALPFLVIGALGCAVIWSLAWAQAYATVYTLTNRRVAMRIGAALTLTLNLPYRQIGAARLDLRSGGTGTIAFDLPKDVRLSFLMTWPHLRPGHYAHTQPALRCIPDATRVAGILAEAAEARLIEPAVAREVDAAATSPGAIPAAGPAHAFAAE